MAKRTAIWKARGASSDVPLLYVEIADTFLRRFLGLMGRKNIAPDRALFLYPCSSVHMCFMRFAIDVVYLKRIDSEKKEDCWKVIKVVKGLLPWIGISACMGAEAVLELQSGHAQMMGLTPGVICEVLQTSHRM